MTIVSHVNTQVSRDVPQREHVHLRLGDLVNPGNLFLEALVKAGSLRARLTMKRGVGLGVCCASVGGRWQSD